MNEDSDLTISNQLTWTNGTIQRTGLTTLGSGATWTISGNPKSLDSDFRNEGTITWLSTAVYQPPGVTFTNIGTIDIQSNDYWGTSGSGAILDNQGTITKSAGNITYIDSVFTNSGSVDVSAGTFRMRTNTTTTGSFTSTGSGVVNFENGTHDLLAASSVTGQNVSFTGSGTADVYGTYSIADTTVSKVVNLMPIAGTIGSITLQSGTLNPATAFGTARSFHEDGRNLQPHWEHSGLRRRDNPGSQPFGNHCFHQPRGGPRHPARGDGGSRLLRRGGAGHQRRCHPQDQEHWWRHRDLRSDFSGDGRGQRGRPDQRAGGLDRLRPPRRLWRGVDRQPLADDTRGIQLRGGSEPPPRRLPDSNALVCTDVLGADEWDCDRTSSTATTVTLEGVTALEDHAAGDAPLAGALFADGFEYRCQRWSNRVDESLDFLVGTRLGGEGCGGWMTNRIPVRALNPEASVAHGRVSGVVTDTSSEAGIEDVEVQFFKDGVQLGRARTAADGSYLSPPLPTGTYTVATHGEGSYLHELWHDLQCWASPDPTLGQTTVVTAEVETADVDFDLELGGRITVTVTAVRTGEVLANVKVRVHSPLGDLEADAVTDDLGFYRTPALPAGIYWVSTEGHRDLKGKVFGGRRCGFDCDLTSGASIQVSPGAETTNIDFVLD